MAELAEGIGLDSIWVGDHLLYRDRGPEPVGPWEAWSQLAALAAVTTASRDRAARGLDELPQPGLLAAKAARDRRDQRRTPDPGTRRGLERGRIPSLRPPVRPAGQPLRGGLHDRPRASCARARSTSPADSSRSRDLPLLPPPAVRAGRRSWSDPSGRECSTITLPHVDAWNAWGPGSATRSRVTCPSANRSTRRAEPPVATRLRWSGRWRCWSPSRARSGAARPVSDEPFDPIPGGRRRAVADAARIRAARRGPCPARPRPHHPRQHRRPGADARRSRRLIPSGPMEPSPDATPCEPAGRPLRPPRGVGADRRRRPCRARARDDAGGRAPRPADDRQARRPASASWSCRSTTTSRSASMAMRSPSGSGPARWPSCRRDQRPLAEHAHVPPWATDRRRRAAAARPGLRRHRVGGGVLLAGAAADLSAAGFVRRTPGSRHAHRPRVRRRGGLRRAAPARARARRRAGRDPGRRCSTAAT